MEKAAEDIFPPKPNDPRFFPHVPNPPLTAAAPKCGNCLYSLRPEMPKSGVVDLSQMKSPPLLCRRYPPQAAALVAPQGVIVVSVDFPQTAPDAWCGEYESATP